MTKVYQILFTNGQRYTGLTNNTVYAKIKNFERKWARGKNTYNLTQAYEKSKGQYKTHVIIENPPNPLDIRNNIIKSSQGKDLNTAYDPFISPFWRE